MRQLAGAVTHTNTVLTMVVVRKSPRADLAVMTRNSQRGEDPLLLLFVDRGSIEDPAADQSCSASTSPATPVSWCSLACVGAGAE